MKIKSLRYVLLIVCLLFVLSMTAARPLQETPADWLTALVTYFLSLAGFAAFITFIVNVAKRFGWVSDGTADVVVKWLNLLGLVIVGVLQAFVPNVIPAVDQILGLLAQLGGVLFPILLGLVSWPVANAISARTHNSVRGFPLFGYSHSKG